MNASGKGGGGVKERMRVIRETAQKKPDFKTTSGKLLTGCRDFFRKPENEEAYQKWKAERKCKAG